MYQFIKRVPISEEYPYGIKKITDNYNPFTEPTFLFLLAINQNDKNTNGSIKVLEQFAGLDKTTSISTDINFCGLSYSDEFLLNSTKYKKITSGIDFKKIPEELIIFANKYLLPLLNDNGQKLDIETCQRAMRNVNIMCYCDALFVPYALSIVLTVAMEKIGYSTEEINTILKEVCIIPVASEYPVLEEISSTMKFTSISFLDIIDSLGISDETTLNNVFGSLQENLYNLSSLINDLSENNSCVNKDSEVVLIRSDGEHALKSFYTKGIAFPAIATNIINNLLNNAIANKKDSFTSVLNVIKSLENIIKKHTDKELSGQSREEILAEQLLQTTYDSYKLSNKSI